MVKSISCEQIVTKITRFIESWFGTPAPDKVTLIEVGPRAAYDRLHILGAQHLSPEQLARADEVIPARFPERGAELIVYGDDESARFAVQIFNRLRYANVFYYPGGKGEWVSRGLWTTSSLTPADKLDRIPVYSKAA